MRLSITRCVTILLTALSFGDAIHARQHVFHVEADPPPMPKERFVWALPSLQVEDFVTGLEIVWDLLFLPDGRLLICERPGRVRVVTADGKLRPESWAEPDNVEHSWVRGALGLALHPDFPDEPWVYLMYTHATEAGPRNRVVRYRDDGERGSDMEVILDDLPSGPSNNGGRITFGPDGMLYVAVGDNIRLEHVQDLDDVRGKILRTTPEGAIPEDNPWPNNPAWAIGFKNSHGLAFHFKTQSLFVADHGNQGRDQLHVVEKGLNYGWPQVIGKAGVEGYEDPLLEWLTSTPPGDMTFYAGQLMPEFYGDLFITTLRSEALIRIRFEDPEAPHHPTSVERWFTRGDLGTVAPGRGDSRFGRLRGIAVGPDGALYVGTSNQDQAEGRVRKGDDRVIRIAPTMDTSPSLRSR